MSKEKYDFSVIVPKFDAILSRGLCRGVGSRDGQMCIEAAICAVLGLPHSDNPECVTQTIRRFKIRLNDSSRWHSPQSRAEGLRDLGLAQIGSRSVISDLVFAKEITDGTIRRLLPHLVRRHFSRSPALMSAADECEKTGSSESAIWLADAAYAAAYHAAAAAADAAFDAAIDAAVDDAADAAAYHAATAAAAAAANTEFYLRFSAGLALEILIRYKSPGAAYISENAVEKLMTYAK